MDGKEVDYAATVPILCFDTLWLRSGLTCDGPFDADDSQLRTMSMLFQNVENKHNLLKWYKSRTGTLLSTLTRMKSVWYVDSMKTEMLWSASGAMTDFAILVTPMGCELEALPPPDTTLRANHVASATLMCSDWGSSVNRQRQSCQNKWE